MIKTTIRALLAASVLALAACTTTQIQETVRTGYGIAGRSEQGDQAAAAAGNIVGSFTPLPLTQEEELGGGIALAAFDTIGPRHSDENIQRYVNLVGRTIARRASRPEIEWRFAVVESPSINAFAGPGGYIFVTTASLRLMENEAELAGVLAHEIIHVTQRHVLKTMRRSQFVDGVAKGAGTFGDNMQQYSNAVTESEDLLLNKGLNRDFELEADAMGIELAAMAGYDPRGLLEFVERSGRANATGGWLQTHPSAGDRAARMRRVLSGDLGTLSGAINRERFQQIKGRLD